MSSEAVRDSGALAGTLLSDVDRLLEIAPNAAQDLLVGALCSSEGQALVAQLQHLRPEEVIRLIQAAGSLPGTLSEVWTAGADAVNRVDADAQAVAQFAALPAFQQQQTPRPIPTAQDGDGNARERSDVMGQALQAWCSTLSSQDDRSALRVLLTAILEADHVNGRNIVEPFLEVSGEWSDQRELDVVLVAMGHRVATLRPKVACSNQSGSCNFNGVGAGLR